MSDHNIDPMEATMLGSYMTVEVAQAFRDFLGAMHKATGTLQPCMGVTIVGSLTGLVFVMDDPETLSLTKRLREVADNGELAELLGVEKYCIFTGEKNTHG